MRVFALSTVLLLARMVATSQDFDPLQNKTSLEVRDVETSKHLPGASVQVTFRDLAFQRKELGGDPRQERTLVWQYTGKPLRGVFGRENEVGGTEYVYRPTQSSDLTLDHPVACYKITVRAPGYEEFVLECPLEKSEESKPNEHIYQLPGHYTLEGWHITPKPLVAYLVKHRSENILRGSVNTQKKTDQDLGVLTTAQLSEQLGVSESEIVKLIKSGVLKGKRIGDKYFVTKEELTRYVNGK